MVQPAVHFDDEPGAEEKVHDPHRGDRNLRADADAGLAESPPQKRLESAVGVSAGELEGFARRTVGVAAEPRDAWRVEQAQSESRLDGDEERLDATAGEELAKDRGRRGQPESVDVGSAPVLDARADRRRHPGRRRRSRTALRGSCTTRQGRDTTPGVSREIPAEAFGALE